MIDQKIRKKIESLTDDRILSCQSVSGGCIANAELLNCSSGKKLFLKTARTPSKMFLAEGKGLKELKKVGVFGIPEVILAEESFLLLEYIEGEAKKINFFSDFGKKFALLHKFQSNNFGFDEDNYIGENIQKNTPVKPAQNGAAYHNGWAAFYWEYRLLYQYRLTEKSGRSTKELLNGISKLENRIEIILKGSEEAPSLLHGDLWGGNYLVGQEGLPYLIDPAVYYGHREADLAMTKLFGGFTQEFYSAYHEEYPLKPGHQQRENLYNLYHMLNHLNIFGQGYYSQTLNMLNAYL